MKPTPPLARARHIAALLLLFLLILTAACAPEPPPPPIYPPTPTDSITPVPLLLTPITTPQALPALPPLINSQSSKALALHDGLLVAVNPDSDSVTLFDIVRGDTNEIMVGDDPRTVAITPDGGRALVALRGEGALAVINLPEKRHEGVIPVGHMPYGVVTDGRRAYVSSFGTDEIVVIDLASGAVIHRVAVPDAPTGLALGDDWLLVTHFYSGDVTLLNIQRMPFVVGVVDAEPDGNLARAIILAPNGERAYIPQTRTGLALVSLQYMQDWFPVVSVLDTTSMTAQRSARLTLSMLDSAPSNMPYDVAFSPDGARLYIALAGSDALLVLDVASTRALARIPVGANPRGVVVDGERVFVVNALDGTLSVIDSAALRVTDTITLTRIPLAPELLRGKVLFHRAEGMSDGAISCATCHFDGGADTRTWINFRSGPRNTPALGGLLPPYNWAGEMDELHDTIEDQIRNVMLGDGLIDGFFDPTTDQIDTGRAADLDALAAYVASLEPWQSPYREADGGLSAAARRGMALFMSGSPDCGCHLPPLYTDQRQHNLVGAGLALEEYTAFDTPTLRGVWASAPYMHDGVAQSLEEVLTRTDPVHSVASRLTPQQLQDLIAFLLAL